MVLRVDRAAGGHAAARVDAEPWCRQYRAHVQQRPVRDHVQAAEHRVAVAVGHAGPVVDGGQAVDVAAVDRSEEHTSELQSLMRISYAVFCLKKKKTQKSKTICSNSIRIQQITNNI